MISENFINSEGWKEKPKTRIHLNAPLTSFPMKGTKTNINKSKENNKKWIEFFCQKLIGILKANNAITNAMRIFWIWLKVMLNDPEVRGRDTEVTMTIPKNNKNVEMNNIGKSTSAKPSERSCLPRKILCNVDWFLNFGIQN